MHRFLRAGAGSCSGTGGAFAAAMLRGWLGGVSIESFREHHLGRAPLAQPSSVAHPEALLDWEILGDVLATDEAMDAIVVARGYHLPLPAPRCLGELRAYFRIGVGLCVRHTERCHPVLKAICDAFEDELGPAQVQLFVTPANTHGLGWHYDDEDVFIAQTDGAKDYYFRANTIAPDEPADGSVFSRFEEESSTLCAASLVAGDFLYIPARWWHMAMSRETSLSISVGVRPRN